MGDMATMDTTDMVMVMDILDMDTMARGLLKLILDTMDMATMDTTDMVMVMDMDIMVIIMERGLLKLNQDIMDMVIMDIMDMVMVMDTMDITMDKFLAFSQEWRIYLTLCNAAISVRIK